MPGKEPCSGSRGRGGENTALNYTRRKRGSEKKHNEKKKPLETAPENDVTLDRESESRSNVTGRGNSFPLRDLLGRRVRRGIEGLGGGAVKQRGRRQKNFRKKKAVEEDDEPRRDDCKKKEPSAGLIFGEGYLKGNRRRKTGTRKIIQRRKNGISLGRRLSA